MTNILPEAHFEQVHVDAAHAAEFEAFCQRNNIPVEALIHSGNKSIYSVRAGRDFSDAQLMTHKMGWNGFKTDDPDFVKAIENLRFYYFYWIPEYQYELSLGPRSNEDAVNWDAVISLWDMWDKCGNRLPTQIYT